MSRFRPYISPNFKAEEFLVSERAVRMGILNEPTEAQWGRAIYLANEILEPWRALMGGKPIHINDGGGFRCARLNNATPGASLSSQHMQMEAVDVTPGISMVEAFRILQESGLPVHQAIFERSSRGGCWIHVSCAPKGVEPSRRFLMHDPGRGIRGYQPWDGRDLCI